MIDELFLGIDGGQSHTDAVVADAKGSILGHGRGGASNHADEPGGPERLRSAVSDSVGQALRSGRLPSLSDIVFVSAHCGMTGGANFKEDVIRAILRSRQLSIGHDAPAALAGASGCKPGIIVVAGTGSVAYGENAQGGCAQAGGWGYLFGDEGGGFGIALNAVRRAAQAQDGMSNATSILRLALQYFEVSDLRNLVQSVYSGRRKRDEFAAFARAVDDAAALDDPEARRIIEEGAKSLAALGAAVARALNLSGDQIHLFRVGGMFRGASFSESFEVAVQNCLPGAQISEPRFEPVIGALLLAYRGANRGCSEEILSNLDKHCGAVFNSNIVERNR